MSPNKRKIFASDTSDEDDNFKHRRSSLRVNLSYCANLTDSGNGSLWRTEIEADEKRIDTARISKRLSRNRRNDTYKKKYQLDSDNEEDLRVKSDTSKFAVNKDTNVSLHVKKEIQLKQLTVKLEDINEKKTLKAKHLKDAILNKTKEIFNRENKLCKRTAMILKTEENYFADIHNTNTGNKSVILDTMTNNQLRNKAIMEHKKCTNFVSNQQRDNQYSNIVTTPTSNKQNSSKRGIDNSSSSKKVIDKSRLTQKQLFAAEDKKIEGRAKCRIIEDIVLKEKFPFSLRQADQDGSPILSGNSRRLSLLRTRSKPSQNQSENHNISFSTIHSQSIGAPIVSSTFNEDIMTENKNNSPSNETNNDIDTSCATHTTNKVISMEMTEVYGGIQISEKQNTNSNAVDNIDNNKKKKSKEKSLEQNKCIIQMQKKENNKENNCLVDKPSMQNNTVHFDSSCTDIASDQNIISMQTTSSNNKMTAVIKPQLQLHKRINKNRNEEQHMLFLSDSDNTILSSLNVNTSLDVITEANKEENVQKTNDYRVNNSNQETITNNKESTALDDQYESSNITEISMKMNTSVNSMHETWQRNNHLQSLSLDKNDEDTTKNYPNMDNQRSLAAENKETNDIDFLENISLIQRLRNMSTQNQVSYNKLKISEMKEKERTDNRSNDVKFQSDEYTDGDNYVKGTPYPISCSDLFRTQLKHRTLNLNNSVTPNNILNSMDNKEHIDKTKSDAS